MKREAFGGGNVKLYTAIVAWFGAEAVLPIVIASSIIGLLYSLIYKLKSGDDEIPFGPAILTGLMIYFVLHALGYQYYMIIY